MNVPIGAMLLTGPTVGNSQQTGPNGTVVFRPSVLDAAGRDAVAMSIEDDLLMHPIGASPSPATASFLPQPSTFVPVPHDNFVPRGMGATRSAPPVLMDVTNVVFHQFPPPVFFPADGAPKSTVSALG